MQPDYKSDRQLAQEQASAGFTVFAALGPFGEPNAADRFAVSHREVLFAM